MKKKTASAASASNSFVPCRETRPRDIVDDFNDLAFACARALDIALKDGAKKFAPGAWRAVAIADHLRHARDHAHRGVSEREYRRTHLAHLLCRAAMAFRNFEEESK
ncbi:hypothetical protein IMX07_10970 [bacterium]|jgi:hypothetical protein|nr:hypothetical protein [bacterium]